MRPWVQEVLLGPSRILKRAYTTHLRRGMDREGWTCIGRSRVTD